MEHKFHLYLTNFRLHESHALSICSNEDLGKIQTAIENIIETIHIGYEETWWFYHENYAKEKAAEMVKPFEGLLEKDSPITKRKYEFFHLGFIITNYPMWPDNNGGYKKDFWI